MLGKIQVFIHAYIPYLLQDFIGKGGLGEYGIGRRTILSSIFQKHVVKVSMIPNSFTSASKRELSGFIPSSIFVTNKCLALKRYYLPC